MPWSKARAALEQARLYWVSTTRPDGRPHAVPIWGAWLEDTFYFEGSPQTRHGRNLAVVVHIERGDLLVMVEGVAEVLHELDPTLFARIADSFAARYAYRPESGEGMYAIRAKVVLAWDEFLLIDLRPRPEIWRRDRARWRLQRPAAHPLSRREPITRDVILALNRLIVDKLIDTAGQFRSGPVSIRGARIQPPPAAQVPKLMCDWIAWVDGGGQGYPTVLRAAIAHHGFEAVHPFLDGNGRTGRLLMNLILMHDGYPPALLLQEWRLAYLEALAVADSGRYGPLANLIGGAVEQGLNLYLEDCERAPFPEGERPLNELAREFGEAV